MSLINVSAKDRLRIRKTHPNFFGTLTLFAVLTLLISLTFIFTPEYYTLSVWEVAKAVVPMWLWGVLGIVSVIIKSYGMWFNKADYIRIGTGLSMIFYLSIGISLFCTTIMYKYAPTGLLIWTSLGILHFIMMLEPYSNPASRSE